MSPSYIEFAYVDQDRFDILTRVFVALQQAKQVDTFRDDDYWLAFFDEQARAHFWWPTPQEADAWLEHWQTASDVQRQSDPALQTPWHFGSMIEAFRNGEYKLIACRQIAPNRGRFEFETTAWPYGGTGCMKALIEAFEGHVIDEVE
jgi:hypothetical protein